MVVQDFLIRKCHRDICMVTKSIVNAYFPLSSSPYDVIYTQMQYFYGPCRRRQSHICHEEEAGV